MEFEFLKNLPREADWYFDNLPHESARKHFRVSWLLAMEQFPDEANEALLHPSDRWPQLAGVLGLDTETGLSLIDEENEDLQEALAEGLAEAAAAAPGLERARRNVEMAAMLARNFAPRRRG